jgi:Leucine-rich repeat (LRR) protein
MFRNNEMNERTKSGFRHDWTKVPDQVDDIASVNSDASTISFRRVKKSHTGLKEFNNVRRLFAYNVDDSFLEEISCLPNLTFLWAETITAEDLSPLARLASLEYLILRSVRNAQKFTFPASMPGLQHLCLEWVKHLHNLSDLTSKDNLLSFGIEGSTELSQRQKIESLLPILDWTELHSLYLGNTKIQDGNLRCLAKIPSLRYLETARFYPKSEFQALKAAHPQLKCQWFDKYEIESP